MDSLPILADRAGMAVEVAGVAVIVIGGLLAVVFALKDLIKGHQDYYNHFRKRMGKGILLGLEFLVAGDIISTVAVRPTFHSVGVLAIIILIRTFLSFILELEMTGRWPWQEQPEERESGRESPGMRGA